MRRVFAVALVLVAACGGSPSSPSRPPASPAPVTFADFSGLWTAKYRITACEWERHCVLYVNTEREFDLRLVQFGSHVRGLYVEGGSAADVEGDVSSDGTLVMTGYRPPVSARDGSLRITEIRFRLASSAELQGQLSYENRTADYYSYISAGMKASGELVSASKSDLSTFAATSDGTYRGRFVVRSCAPISMYCYPDPVEELDDIVLTVARSESGVTATFQRGGTRLPLQGTISGATMDLAGEGTTSASGGDSLTRITDWHGTIDAFGRISGTFHLYFGFPVAKPTLGGSAECELVQLVKTVS